jgi:hypothetical protein
VTTVRKFSPVGPCIEQGVLIGQTAKFYCFVDRFERGNTRRLGKTWAVHIEPCPSCRDHPRTQYPNGYEN